MRVCVIYSSAQSYCGDRVVLDLASSISAFAANDVDIVNADNHQVPQGEYDIVVLYNSAAWYVANRHALKGRPWLCVYSTCFADLISLMNGSSIMLDSGLHQIFTNCWTLIKQTSPALSAKFTYPPVPRFQQKAKRGTLFGAVLPNVVDRDFSQLTWTANYLRSINKRDRLTIFASNDNAMRLPNELAALSLPAEELQDVFTDIEYLIPVPRVTDYRAAVIPTEIIYALVAGCKPLLVRHPNLEYLDNVVVPMFRSLRDYKTALDAGLFSAPSPVVTDVTKLPLITPAGAAADILMAYDTWREHASA